MAPTTGSIENVSVDDLHGLEFPVIADATTGRALTAKQRSRLFPQVFNADTQIRPVPVKEGPKSTVILVPLFEVIPAPEGTDHWYAVADGTVFIL